eukprot:10847151-Prorocentrum_lima.AAC.1
MVIKRRISHPEIPRHPPVDSSQRLGNADLERDAGLPMYNHHHHPPPTSSPPTPPTSNHGKTKTLPVFGITKGLLAW